MRVRNVLLVGCLVGLLGGLGSGQEAPDYVIRKDHPRLLITREDIPRIGRLCGEGGPLREDYLLLKEHLDLRMKTEPVWGTLRSLHTWALVALLEEHWGHKEEADKYANYAIKQLDLLAKEGGNRWLPGYEQHEVYHAAFAIDWLWNRLTPEQRRNYARAHGVPSDKATDIIWASSPQQIVMSRLARSLLYYGEGIDDPGYRAEFEACRRWVREDLAPGYNLSGGPFPSGFDYGGRQYGISWCFELLRVATGEDLWAGNKWAREFGAWYLYGLLPETGTLAMNQDCGRNDLTGPPAYCVYLHARRCRDSCAQWFAERMRRERYEGNERWRYLYTWPKLVWYDPEVPAAELDKLPRARLFGQGGMDVAVMRTGWDPDDTYIAFWCGENYYGHHHRMCGHFDIHHKGRLAIDSGSYMEYQATQGGKDIGWYYRTTLAHNTLTVYNPQDLKRHPDGGQWGAMMDHFSWWKPGGERDIANIIAFESQPLYDYVAGEAHKAYCYPSKRLTEFTRQLVYLPPSHLVIFDRVTATDPTFTKDWLLHVNQKPQVVGGTAELIEDATGGGGEKAGIWEHRNEDYVRIVDGEGQLLMTPLLPAEHILRVVGGPKEPILIDRGPFKGHFYFGGHPRGYEFWSKPGGKPGGRNCWYRIDPEKVRLAAQEEAGWGRIELEPARPRHRDLFLVVLQICDRQVRVPDRVKLVEEGDQIGATVTTRTGRRWQVTFNRFGPVGGRVQVWEGKEMLLDRRLTQKIESNSP